MPEIELVEPDRERVSEQRDLATLPAIAERSPASMMLAALDRGIDPERIEKMLELQERWEANEARKAFASDLAAFKGEAVEIIKRKQVDFQTAKGRTQYKHAELFDVIEGVGPALSKHGFSWGWDMKQSDRWLEVTCVLRHRLGHCERVTLGGPPDESGGKNAIQAIMSTKTYLERHTLKAACGVAEKGEDDDGAGGASRNADWLAAVDAASTEDELRQIAEEGVDAFTKAKDVPGYSAFMKAVTAKRKSLGREQAHA
jgi:hypothetical protein